jgi:hypothetical protein
VKARPYFDDAERCATVHVVYVRPGWDERIAERYAPFFPSMPPIFSAVLAGAE